MTRRRRAVFLGSGAFAVPVLAALAEHPACELVGVVSAPPRPAGRGGSPTPTPVAALAAASGWPVLTPQRLRSPESVAAIAALTPDLIVLADYGQLVPPTLLELPAFGALNLHPSLLPRHRGASPIPAAILAGDGETGVSLMLMDEGLDSGPLLAQEPEPLDGRETTPELEARLAARAADLLARSLDGWLSGVLRTTPQPSDGVTMTRPLRREDGRLDPRQGGVVLERMVRAYQPWPGTWFETGHGRIVVWRAAPPPAHEATADPAAAGGRAAAEGGPGTVVADGDGLAITVADGRLRLIEVQPAGGRRMTAGELRRGRPGLVGSRLLPPSLA